MRGGYRAWETRLDNYRQGECMCVHCSAYKPTKTKACPQALEMFRIGNDSGVRFIVTRCPNFKDIADEIGGAT